MSRFEEGKLVGGNDSPSQGQGRYQGSVPGVKRECGSHGRLDACTMIREECFVNLVLLDSHADSVAMTHLYISFEV